MEVSDRILLGNGWYRLWGLAFLVACLPSTLAFDSAPIPPPPFPAGRGRFLVFLCKGLRPLHPRGWVGCGTGFACGKRGTAGGLPSWLPAAPAFSLLCCPPSPKGKDIPPDPRSQSALPLRGRGRPRLFHARGFAPCIPGAGRDAALGLLVESGLWRGACFFGCLPPLPLAYFAAPLPRRGRISPPTRARRALFPSGEGGDQGYFMQGASPLASPGLGGMRHWGCLWKAGCGGGLAFLVACRPCL